MTKTSSMDTMKALIAKNDTALAEFKIEQDKALNQFKQSQENELEENGVIFAKNDTEGLSREKITEYLKNEMKTLDDYASQSGIFNPDGYYMDNAGNIIEKTL